MSEEEFNLLEEVFGQGNVLKEWDIAKNSRDALNRELQYCPRIDYAIKPLNIDGEIEHNNELINNSYKKYENLLNNLRDKSLGYGFWTINMNPRCFLAIEYENKTTTKHRVGSLINAGAMGKIGIIVAKNAPTFNSYKRILSYLEYLEMHKKQKMVNNFFVITINEFEESLRKYIGSRNKV